MARCTAARIAMRSGQDKGIKMMELVGEITGYGEDPDEVLLRLMQLEEQLAYAYARCSVLHRVKAKEFRDVLYDDRFGDI